MARLAIVAILPFLIAASDPTGDVTGCRGGAGSGAPDLTRADGSILELGTSARWELTFAAPLEVPDPEGRPFRVDVAIYDPTAPAESFAYYRRVNRIVRVDATIDHPTEIYLLPERAANGFEPPVIDDRTMTIRVPGRILTEDRGVSGTSPGLKELRWTVIVRDGRACDFLGDGRPTERLVPGATVRENLRPPASSAGAWIAALVIVGVLGCTAYVLRRRFR